jgi:hypothetical protein
MLMLIGFLDSWCVVLKKQLLLFYLIFKILKYIYFIDGVSGGAPTKKNNYLYF